MGAQGFPVRRNPRKSVPSASCEAAGGHRQDCGRAGPGATAAHCRSLLARAPSSGRGGAGHSSSQEMSTFSFFQETHSCEMKTAAPPGHILGRASVHRQAHRPTFAEFFKIRPLTVLFTPHTCSDMMLSAVWTGLSPITALQGQNQDSFVQRKDL